MDYTLFIGSSIVELKEERQSLSALTQALNDLWVQQDIDLFLDSFLCEYQSATITFYSSQTIINQQLISSDLAIFIVNKKFGEYTKGEFDLAYQTYQKLGKPKIVVYRRVLDIHEKRTEEANDFLSSLQSLGVSEEIYDTIKTLKTAFLQTVNAYIQKLDIQTMDQYIVVNGKKLNI
jgi:hypothetical protein